MKKKIALGLCIKRDKKKKGKVVPDNIFRFFNGLRIMRENEIGPVALG